MYYKLNSRWMVNINVRCRAIVHLEGTIGKYLFWPRGGQRSFIDKLCFVKMKICCSKDSIKEGFLGNSVLKNLLARAGDMGSSPSPGISHMLQSS